MAGKEEEKEKERKKEEDDDDNKYASRTSGSGAAVPFGPSVVTLLCDISRGPSGGGGGQAKGRWEYFQPSSVPYYLLPRVLGGRSDAYVLRRMSVACSTSFSHPDFHGS